MRVLLCVLLLVPLACASTSEQAGTYTAINPWSASFPDCAIAPGGASMGLGGACFSVPVGATQYRVTLEDLALGPGHGALNLCEDDGSGLGCAAVPICNGVAEGNIPAGVTRASVVVYDVIGAVTFCGTDAAAWAPVHGIITLSIG